MNPTRIWDYRDFDKQVYTFLFISSHDSCIQNHKITDKMQHLINIVRLRK
jgi:hypothetical protein